MGVGDRRLQVMNKKLRRDDDIFGHVHSGLFTGAGAAWQRFFVAARQCRRWTSDIAVRGRDNVTTSG
jgi:hypothetical protein